MEETPARSTARSKVLTIGLAVAFALAFVALSVQFFRSRPQWILLIDNEPDATRIRIITTQSDTPIYQVHVRGERFCCAPITLPASAAEDVEIEGIETLFIDRTLGPGRWTVRVGSVTLDFWESFLSVDDKQYTPSADVTIDGMHGFALAMP